jgi:hypothetical protein
VVACQVHAASLDNIDMYGLAGHAARPLEPEGQGRLHPVCLYVGFLLLLLTTLTCTCYVWLAGHARGPLEPEGQGWIHPDAAGLLECGRCRPAGAQRTLLLRESRHMRIPGTCHDACWSFEACMQQQAVLCTDLSCHLPEMLSSCCRNSAQS